MGATTGSVTSDGILNLEQDPRQILSLGIAPTVFHDAAERLGSEKSAGEARLIMTRPTYNHCCVPQASLDRLILQQIILSSVDSGCTTRFVGIAYLQWMHEMLSRTLEAQVTF